MIDLCDLVFGISAKELNAKPLPPTAPAFRRPFELFFVTRRISWRWYWRALSCIVRIRLPVRITDGTNVLFIAGSWRTPSRAHCHHTCPCRRAAKPVAGDRPHGVLDPVFFAEQSEGKNRSLSLRPVVPNRWAFASRPTKLGNLVGGRRLWTRPSARLSFSQLTHDRRGWWFSLISLVERGI